MAVLNTDCYASPRARLKSTSPHSYCQCPHKEQGSHSSCQSGFIRHLQQPTGMSRETSVAVCYYLCQTSCVFFCSKTPRILWKWLGCRATCAEGPFHSRQEKQSTGSLLIFQNGLWFLLTGTSPPLPFGGWMLRTDSQAPEECHPSLKEIQSCGHFRQRIPENAFSDVWALMKHGIYIAR